MDNLTGTPTSRINERRQRVQDVANKHQRKVYAIAIYGDDYKCQAGTYGSLLFEPIEWLPLSNCILACYRDYSVVLAIEKGLLEEGGSTPYVVYTFEPEEVETVISEGDAMLEFFSTPSTTPWQGFKKWRH